MCDTTIIDYETRFRKYLYLFAAIILFFVALIFLISTPVSALEINGEVYNNTISWYWDVYTVSNISIDGEYVYGFVPNGTQYQKTFDDKTPINHILIVYEGNNEVGYNISKTTGEPSPNDLIPIFTKYVWLLIGIVLLIVGKILKRSEPALMSGFIAFVGLGMIGDELIGKIIYGLLLIVSFYISFED